MYPWTAIRARSGFAGAATLLLLGASGCRGAPPDPLPDILGTGETPIDEPAGMALPSEDRMEEALDRLREHLGVPGMGMVVVTSDGSVRLAVTGERAAGSGAPIQRDDPWHLGSNAKAMTPLLVARLVRDGGISWDDTVADVLAGRVEDMAGGWEDASYRHLLTHCAGLPANASVFTLLRLVGDDSRDDAADRLRYASNVLADPPRTAPGETVAYSNAGYVVAAAMLEAQTARNWRALMEEQIVGPLGLTSAGFGPPGSVDSLDAPRGHTRRWFGLGRLRAEPPDFGADNPPALGPAGRIHMNLADYGRFLLDQLRGPAGDGDLLSAAEYRQLQSPGCDPGMAHGWGVTGDGHLRHAGSNGMWYVETVIWTRDGAAMAVVSNDGRVDHQRESFLALMKEFRGAYLNHDHARNGVME